MPRKKRFLHHTHVARSCAPHSETKKRSFFASLVRCTDTHFIRLSCSPRKRRCEASPLRSGSLRHKPDSVMSSHISGMNVAIHLERLSDEISNWCIPSARPCTQVGILPLHPVCFHTSSSLRMPSPLSLGVSVRIPGITPAGVTRYRPTSDCSDVRVRTFLSDYSERLLGAGL